MNTDKIMNEIQEREEEIQVEKTESFGIFTGEAVMNEYERLQKEYGEGLETGFDALDKYFTLLPEHLYLISAPTHQGKTTLSLNIAARVATYGHNVLFASLEQGLFIAPRVKTMLEGDFPKTLSVLTTHKMLKVETIIKAVQSMKAKPKLLVLDHLHFIKKAGNGTTADIDDMIIEIQNAAKELHLPIIVVTHVRKLNGDRPPGLDDLRDSSSLSQVPSVVMLLYRPLNDVDAQIKGAEYLASFGSLVIAKNRIQGKTGAISFTLKKTGEFIF